MQHLWWCYIVYFSFLSIYNFIWQKHRKYLNSEMIINPSVSWVASKVEKYWYTHMNKMNLKFSITAAITKGLILRKHGKNIQRLWQCHNLPWKLTSTHCCVDLCYYLTVGCCVCMHGWIGCTTCHVVSFFLGFCCCHTGLWLADEILWHDKNKLLLNTFADNLVLCPTHSMCEIEDFCAVEATPPNLRY